MDLPVTWIAVLTRAALCVMMAVFTVFVWLHPGRSMFAAVLFAMMSVGSAIFTIAGIVRLRSRPSEPATEEPRSRRLAGPGRIFHRS